MKKTVAFLVPDGIGVRNYLFSSLPSILSEKGTRIILLHNLPNDAIQEIKNVDNLNIEAIEIPKYNESWKELFLRELECLSRLKYFSKKLNNPTLLTNWPKKRVKIKHKLFYGLIEIVSLLITNYNRILYINRLYQKTIQKRSIFNEFKSFIYNLKIETLFCTHQRAIVASPLIMATKELNIRTTTAIYSWDNLPKARLAFRADDYLVWSQHMKQELMLFYPEIATEAIIVTGTPQFEFYQNPDLIWSRETFCKKFDLNIQRKTVCFSGGDLMTSPFDAIYLTDLLHAIDKIPQPERPQVLLRRCPVDWSNRFKNILEKNRDNLKIADPIWSNDASNNNWSQIYPKYADVELLVNVAYHCEAVYNLGSTMALDFSLFNKPAFFINYDIPNNINYSVETIYNYQHFKSMPSPDAVIWINNKYEIASKVLECLRNPHKVAPIRLKWLEKIIKTPVNKVSEHIANVLIKGASEKSIVNYLQQ